MFCLGIRRFLIIDLLTAFFLDRGMRMFMLILRLVNIRRSCGMLHDQLGVIETPRQTWSVLRLREDLGYHFFAGLLVFLGPPLILALIKDLNAVLAQWVDWPRLGFLIEFRSFRGVLELNVRLDLS